MTIKETIEYCRANTQRRVSVLGYAQLNTPLAYQELIDTKPTYQSIAEYLGTCNHDPKHLIALLRAREYKLKTKK